MPDISSIEKIELHCHLGGIVCPDYVAALQRKGLLTSIDLMEMQSFYPMRNLKEWNLFLDRYGSYVSGQGELLLEFLKLHLQVLRQQNVRYVEIMLQSFLMVPEDELAELMPRYRSVADEMPDIDVGYLWAIGRTSDQAKFRRKVERVLQQWRQGYVDGLAVASDEENCRIRDYEDIFDEITAAGLPVEIHAGETKGPDYIWDAIEYGRPKRVGHALSLFEDPSLVDYFRDSQTHIEFCPTSNLKVGTITSIEEHPIFKAADVGLNFSINTDDPGQFECTMDSEFALVQSVRSLDTNQIFENSKRAAFRVI